MILFETAAFDATTGRHPKDPALVGLPFLLWLGPLVAEQGGAAEGEPVANDDGWMQCFAYGGRRFWVGVHAVAEPGRPVVAHSVLVQTIDTLIEKISGGPDRSVDDDLIHLIERLLIAHGIADSPTVAIDG